MKTFLITSLIILSHLTSAIVGRHDRPSGDYENYAYELTCLGPGEAAGRLEALDGSENSEEYKCYGSCVLIDSFYILTAAHQQADLTSRKPRVVFTDKNSNLVTAPIIDWKQHPNYNPKIIQNGYDLAIGKLAKPITTIKSLPLSNNYLSDIAGKKGYLIGYGVWMNEGDHQAQDDGKKRAGRGVIYPHFFSTNPILYTPFDNPTYPRLRNFLPTRNRLPVDEYAFLLTSRDSGAPLLIKENGKYRIVGIASFSRLIRIEDEKKYIYGSSSGYSAIPSSRDWIHATIIKDCITYLPGASSMGIANIAGIACLRFLLKYRKGFSSS